MTEIESRVGRIVWGHPGEPRQKKYQDGPEKGKVVMKDGQPVLQWSFGVAFPKAEFTATIYQAMAAEVLPSYGNNPQAVPPKFAWKYVDGDGFDSDGKPFNLREGYAGCYVLAVTTEAFAPNMWKYENGVYRQIDAKEIKCGDFVVLKLSFKLNIPTDKTRVPSVYVNPQGVVLIGYGKHIITNADPTKMFGGAPSWQLPPGASATPMLDAGASMPNGQQPGGYAPPTHQQPQQQYAPQPGQMPPQQQYAPPQMQQPQQQYAPQPGQMPPQGGPISSGPGMAPGQYAPAHDFVQNAGQQAPQMQQPQQQYAPQPGQMPPQQQQYPGGYQPQPGGYAPPR